MGRPKKSRYVGVHVSHGVVNRVDHGPAAAHGVDAAAAAAAIAAAKLVQHSDPHDSADDEEDEEAAEFRREAAELLKHRQQQSALPSGLRQKDLDGAIKSLVSQAGISKQEAEDALMATAEQYHTQFDEWMNEAMMWLAIQSENQSEAAKIRVAMEVSLREQEAALQAEQAAAAPLTNLSEEKLRTKFADSVTLRRLHAVLPWSVLFSNQAPFKDLVKIKLVDFLCMETNCFKWWPDKGTQQYFEDLAGKLCEEISQASSSRSSITAVAGVPPAAAQPAAAGATAAAPIDPILVKAEASSSFAAAQGAAAQQGQQLQAAAGSLQHTGDRSSSPPVSPALADGGCAPAAGVLGLPAAAAGITGGVSGSAAAVSCLLSCEPGVSGPCSTACTDSMGGDAQLDDGAATGVRTSKRKRQPPARYSSPSPGQSADAHKKQQSALADEQQPAKRLASLDCLAAGGQDSTARRSASLPPAHLQPSAGRAASTAASGQEHSAPDSRQQQDRGTAGLQQQQQPQPQQQLGLPANASALPACDAGGCSSDGLQAYLSASQCLSQLLDAELAVLRHHIYTMPDRSGGMPSIFQLPEDQQADDGDDSDVEVVGVRQPTEGRDIPEPLSPADPALQNTQQQQTPLAAGAAVAGQAEPGAAAHTLPAAAALTSAAAALAPLQQAGSSMAATAAAAAEAAEAQALLDFGWPGYAGLSAGAHLYMPGQAGSGAAAGAAIPGYGLQGEDMYSPGAVQYRASTNESGDLVIEID